MGLLRAAFAILLVAISTVGHCSLLFLVALLKLLLPFEGARRVVSRWLVVIAESWIGFNSTLIDVVTPTRIEVEGLDGLAHDGWYLVVSNHQSWVDIPVLQKVFNRRIPFLKFFLKQQLIWVPFLGLAWWALDFPFMRRYSREQIAARPELAGKDIEVTRAACRRFKRLPVSVMNFVEGTRYTPAKHAQQGSPHARLLRPKAGGVGFVLGAMDGLLKSMVDVTLVYPAGRPSVLDLFAGRIPSVRVHIQRRDIPADMVGDYENDAAFRQRFQDWINGIWTEKDARMAAMEAA